MLAKARALARAHGLAGRADCVGGRGRSWGQKDSYDIELLFDEHNLVIRRIIRNNRKRGWKWTRTGTQTL